MTPIKEALEAGIKSLPEKVTKRFYREKAKALKKKKGIVISLEKRRNQKAFSRR